MNAETESSNFAEPSEKPASFPLVVDLDGTLVCTDLLAESFFSMITRNPLYIFSVPLWLLKGRAYLKQEIGRRVSLDVSALPYNSKLLDHLKEQRSKGRRIVMATASDARIARQVADHLGIFDAILSSDGNINLSGYRKRDRLIEEFGEKNFDYIGDNRRDLAVWSSAHRAILVNPTRGLSRLVAKVVEIERIFESGREGIKPYAQALRLHHWMKNVLIFVPLVMAHRFLELELLIYSVLAFSAFGLCASSVYIINDIVDLPADRLHPWKQHRPFAAGELSLFRGLTLIPLLLGASILVSLMLPPPFLTMLGIYFFLNLGYSFILKRIVVLDVIVLAALYTMRIMAGSASVAVWPSPLILAFSAFLFLSLALLKRYGELAAMSALRCEMVQFRGYMCIDKELLSALGSGSGYVAVLVLGIYIASGGAKISYTRHDFLWLLCPLLLYWITRVWLIAHRGEMREDPLIFTMKDRTSRAVFVLAAVIALLAGWEGA